MNLYAYLGSNPVNLNDALGLTYDDSWLDDFIDDYTGHRLYALGMINEGARWASLGLETTLGIAGTLLGVDVFQSVKVLASGQGGFWDAMNIVLAVTPVARLGKAAGAIAKGAGFMFQASRATRKVVGAFRKFTRRNFRHNLGVLRGFDPGDAYQAHHAFPHKFTDKFDKLGINVNDPKYGSWWGKGPHQSRSHSIEKEWNEFFGPNGVPSPEAARQLAYSQAQRFGFTVGF